MTSRDDALRKVQSLNRLADDPGNNGYEREAARQKATELRLKHGIGDADLALLDDDDDEDLEFFGIKLGYFSRHIQPHIARAKAEVDTALKKADTLDPLNKATIYCRVYKEMRGWLDGAYYKDQLKERRDKVVKDFYQLVAYNYAAERNGDVSETMQHTWARDRTASACDLRKDVVERIVGISEHELLIKAHRTLVCEKCGKDGNEGRQMCDLYEIDGERQWMHPDCAPEEAKARR